MWIKALILWQLFGVCFYMADYKIGKKSEKKSPAGKIYPNEKIEKGVDVR